MTEADDFREKGIFTLTLDGEEYCVPRYCPHRGGRLDYGNINPRRKTVTCPLHHSVFDLETGEQLSGPECGRLTVGKKKPQAAGQ